MAASAGSPSTATGLKAILRERPEAAMAMLATLAERIATGVGFADDGTRSRPADRDGHVPVQRHRGIDAARQRARARCVPTATLLERHHAILRGGLRRATTASSAGPRAMRSWSCSATRRRPSRPRSRRSGRWRPSPGRPTRVGPGPDGTPLRRGHRPVATTTSGATSTAPPGWRRRPTAARSCCRRRRWRSRGARCPRASASSTSVSTGCAGSSSRIGCTS